MKIEIGRIIQSKNALRKIQKGERFHELVESINAHGLLQPVKVRPRGDKYEIVYGNRRVAAAKELRWTKIEAIVEELNDEEAYLQSAIENLHRDDLTVFEEARIYEELRARGLSISQIAEKVNKSHGQITNRLSLLRLPKDVQALVDAGGKQQISTTATGGLSVDSASRISAASADPDEARLLARKAISERLTTREVRSLTALFKQAESEAERRSLLEKPFAINPEGFGPPSATGGPKYHAEDVPISAQLHGKLVWNLNRIDVAKYHHFSIGYSLRSLEQLVEILSAAQVTFVADVRKNPISQYRPEFSKGNLARYLRDNQIAYGHFPALGIDTAERKELGKQTNYSRLFDTYEKNVTWDLIRQELGGLLKEERIAFLCVEIDPNLCHRHRLIRILERNNFKTLDL